MVWIAFVILVEYRVTHDGLAVNGQNRVCRYVYPIFCITISHGCWRIYVNGLPSLSDQSISLTSLKGQGFAGHEHKVGSLVLAVHLVFSVGRV